MMVDLVRKDVRRMMKALDPYLKNWNVKIELGFYVPLRHQSPFSTKMGINFRQRIIYVTDDCTDPGNLIHEVGHLVATKKPLSDDTEFHWFGWEYHLAKRAKVLDIWLRDQGDYRVLYTDPIENTTYGDLRDVLGASKAIQKRFFKHITDISVKHKRISPETHEPLNYRAS